MKKILYIFLSLAAGATVLQSCDPLDDTYAELDKGAIDNAGVVEMTYELVDADYTSLKDISKNSATNLSFISEDSAKVLIPNILNNKYRYAEETSTVDVTYKLKDVNSKVNASVAYTLNDADYLEITGPSTSDPSKPRFANLNSNAQIITAASLKNKTPKEGDVVKLSFKWSGATVIDSTTQVIFVNGEWNPAYTLATSDYRAMKQTRDNFSSKSLVVSYLPIFLATKFPYDITENAVLPVLYNFYNSTTRATTQEVAIMKYISGVWIIISGDIKATSKFAVKNGKWVADNTIKYTLITDDYKVAIANLVKTESVSLSENIARYGNFDMRYWSVDQITKYLGLFADDKFPEAVVGQACVLTYITYSPSATLTKTYVKKENGKFEVQ